MTTATLDRIRRCNRESEYGTAKNDVLFASRPDAKPNGSDNYTLDSFFDSTAHAQIMVDEKFTVLSSLRTAQAAECAEPLKIGTDIAIVPKLPLIRMQDLSQGLNAAMTLAGISVDLALEKNSIETRG